jgi:hypothetical protein
MRITYEDAMQIQTDFESQPPEENSVTNISLLNDKPDSHYGTVAATDNEDPPVIESSSLTVFFNFFKETPFFTVFTELSYKAIPMALSFTFSFEVFLAVSLLQIMSESEEDTAAAGLVSTMMNFVCTLAMSPLFAASMDLSKKIGRWREARKVELELEEIAEESIQELSPATTKELEKEKIEIVNINMGVILDAIRFNLLQQFRALDDFFVTSIIAFFGLSSGILLAAVLGFKTPLDIDGVGIGYTLGVMITAVLLGLRWETKIAEVVAVGVENNAPLELVPS